MAPTECFLELNWTYYTLYWPFLQLCVWFQAAIKLYHQITRPKTLKVKSGLRTKQLLRQQNNDVIAAHVRPPLRVVWRSLTPPSKIGKGSGEPRIIDLCHKQNSGSSNQISKRNSYIILCYVITIYARCAREGEKTDGECSGEQSYFGCEGGCIRGS